MRDGVLTVRSCYFDAGLVLRGGIVREAAPILRYMRGWPEWRVHEYCRHKGWHTLWG